MITFDQITKTYKTSTRPALDNISVTIEKGEFVFLIGPSGSGKSTFLQLMLREETPTSGDLYVADYHVNRLRGSQVNKLRQRIGYVFQDFRLLPKKTVYENVAFALEVIGKRRSVIDKQVPATLDMVGLAAKGDRMPGELSGGEQQRVAIARASVNRPLLLLADEPTGNLDPETANDIMVLLNRINKTGTTVVMSTHNNSAVDAMRRRVIELELGKLVRDEAHGVYGVGR
ncbi:cell division ATP-binding protein FtsE [Corynebacterium durum]|uniref:Cell division ATP-binding protein FtsE n=1 Tax=Corynebacterium durum F0235 TaxID=1035195 RepID=L1MI67_9CORY|nr:cell division ATP-binding protein FtsE [Corynebacterium durum]EKX90963.1 cell division ATP-binding protein FtsE [Corynebacterium durum F0235]NYI75287.1 cell division transport system ATP-binding protein [Corynebacterium durum]WJY84417.1 Cell division ATP-binding protein FtsE [Corynebacterium durum]